MLVEKLLKKRKKNSHVIQARMAPVFSDSQLLGWDPKYPGDYFLDGRAVGQDSLDLVLEKWFQLIDGSYFLNEILFNWGKTYGFTLTIPILHKSIVRQSHEKMFVS